jgi:membrane protein DedA with SNARE-associated domain
VRRHPTARLWHRHRAAALEALEELDLAVAVVLPSTLTLTTAGPYFSTIQLKPGNCVVAAGAATAAGAAVAWTAGGAPART